MATAEPAISSMVTAANEQAASTIRDLGVSLFAARERRLAKEPPLKEQEIQPGPENYVDGNPPMPPVVRPFCACDVRP